MEKIPFFVRIAKIPEGPAPVEIRKAWVGLKLPAFRENPWGEEDFLTGAKMRVRESIIVPVEPAINILRKKDSGAATWFINNMPPWVRLFTFGANEVEIIR